MLRSRMLPPRNTPWRSCRTFRLGLITDINLAATAETLLLGANAFFPKPYSPFALRQKIEELTRET